MYYGGECVSFPNSSLGMPIAKLRLVCQRTKQVYLYAHNTQHQAELEGKHSQAGASLPLS
jgi:hypothetical protein